MGRRGRDRIGLTTTCVMNAYQHLSCECKSCSLQGVLETTLCDKVVHRLAAVHWFSLVLRFPPPIKLTVTI
jgi:hypothetical protein